MDDRVYVAFDTAGPTIGVAACRGSDIEVHTARAQRGAEGRLIPWLDGVLVALGAVPKDIAGVGCTVGPGTFTGLRVGLSTTVGLAMGLGVPVWTCDSLWPRAVRVNAHERLLVVLDARKGRVYAAMHQGGARVGAISDVAPMELLAALEPGTWVTGEAAGVYKDLWEGAGARVVDTWEDPGVGHLVGLTREGLLRGEGESPSRVRPLYVRRPDAKTMAERGVS